MLVFIVGHILYGAFCTLKSRLSLPMSLRAVWSHSNIQCHTVYKRLFRSHLCIMIRHHWLQFHILLNISILGLAGFSFSHHSHFDVDRVCARVFPVSLSVKLRCDSPVLCWQWIFNCLIIFNLGRNSLIETIHLWSASVHVAAARPFVQQLHYHVQFVLCDIGQLWVTAFLWQATSVSVVLSLPITGLLDKASEMTCVFCLGTELHQLLHIARALHQNPHDVSEAPEAYDLR